MKKKTACKKIITLSLIIILIVNTLTVSALGSEPDFLIGDWETADGVELSFSSDHSYYMKWNGFLQLAETGIWRTGWQSDNVFAITFDGLGLLKIIEYINGILVSNYHFEILKCNNDNFYLVQVYGSYTAYTSPAKLAFTRVGAYKDFSTPEKPEQEKPGVDEENKAKDTPVTLHFDDNVEDTIHINWGWEYFLEGAETYNHNLAMAGLAISSMIHHTDTFEKDLKANFGFEDIIYDPGSTPGYAFAHKKITVSNQTKHVILVAVRGTNLGISGWDGLVDIAGLIDGYTVATTYISSMLDVYIKDKGCNRNNTILFITGHSLGGGVAQSLAPVAERYVSSNSNSFIYTFAATNVAVNIGGYYNVHNIVNQADIVPFLPPNYRKYGRIWYYNSGDTQKYQEYFDKLCKKENAELTALPWKSGDKHSAHQPETYFAMMVCDLPRDMDSGVENPYSLTSVECPVDVTVKDHAGNVMGRTEGSSVTLEDNTKVFITVEGESKKILAPPGVQYVVEITGTGDGTMDIIHRLINPVTGQAVDTKKYYDIKVRKDQKFTLDVDGSPTEELELLGTDRKNSLDSDTDQTSVLIYILIAVLVVLLAELIVLIFLIRRRNRN